MISGRKMIDIASMTRLMEDFDARNYVCDNWQKIKEAEKQMDDEWAIKLIDAIATEKIPEIMKFI